MQIVLVFLVQLAVLEQILFFLLTFCLKDALQVVGQGRVPDVDLLFEGYDFLFVQVKGLVYFLEFGFKICYLGFVVGVEDRFDLLVLLYIV